MRWTPTPSPLSGSARRRPATMVVALLAVLLGTQVSPSPAGADEQVRMYQGQEFPWPAASPTQDKPQSKLWFVDGSWWALMRSADAGSDGTPDVTVHELQADHTWRDTGIVIDERASSTGDALWEGGKLYVASRSNSSTGGYAEVARLSYDASVDRYTMDEGFPVTVSATSVTSVTIARDSRRRLWVTYTEPDPADGTRDRVMVAHSTDDDLTWAAPFPVPVADSTVRTDDISAIVAFGGKVGVMWSDQQDEVVRFAVHPDGSAADQDWTMETALSGTRSTDDHINVKSLIEDENGRIYAAIKTSRGDVVTDSPDDPSIQVLTRARDGDWTAATAATVSHGLTRPQLALDATNRELYVIMSTEGGGTVYYKKSPMGDSLTFPSGTPGATMLTWDGARINNATTAKAPVTAESGLVVLASDNKSTRRYYHAELDLAGAPADSVAPSVPSGVSAVADEAGQVTVRWEPSTDDTGVASYRVIRSGTVLAEAVDATTFVDPTVEAGSTYRYTVSAVDAAGNRSAESAPASVDVPAEPAPEPAPQPEPEPEPQPSTGTFSDVPPGAPFARDIEWLAAQGIAKGHADGTFRPRSRVVRQAMAVFLYHFAHRDTAAPRCSSAAFPDVPAESLYCGSIGWLHEEGITRGTSSGTFRPLGSVTRQSMAAFLYHLAHDGAAPPRCTRDAFGDVPASSPYCGSIAWLSDQGITTSSPSGDFAPTGTVTRGMMAAFLHRFDAV